MGNSDFQWKGRDRGILKFVKEKGHKTPKPFDWLTQEISVQKYR